MPYRVHVEHGDIAGGTGVVAAVDQHPEAGLVDHVAAGRDVRRNAGRVDVLHADGAVGPARPLHTLTGGGGGQYTGEGWGQSVKRLVCSTD